MPRSGRKRRLVAFVAALAVLITVPLTVVASDVFTDVPNSNVFHDDITWLANAGVTKGCNPPDNTLFCPSDNVTREQMAAFMHRLAVNQVVDAATAQEADHAADADTVSGMTVDKFAPAVFGKACTTDCAEALKVMSMDIDAPDPGVVQFDYSLTTDNTDSSGPDAQFAWIAAGDTCETQLILFFVIPKNAMPGSTTETFLPATSVGSLSGTTALSVSAGTQTFSLCQLNYASSYNIVYGSLTGVWTPAGSSVPIASASDVATYSQEQINQFKQTLGEYHGQDG